jgi:hypothetical protein
MRVQASLEQVAEFYRSRGFKVVRNPVGLTVTPAAGDGILQVLPGEGRFLDLYFIARTRAPEP